MHGRVRRFWTFTKVTKCSCGTEYQVVDNKESCPTCSGVWFLKCYCGNILKRKGEGEIQCSCGRILGRNYAQGF